MAESSIEYVFVFEIQISEDKNRRVQKGRRVSGQCRGDMKTGTGC